MDTPVDEANHRVANRKGHFYKGVKRDGGTVSLPATTSLPQIDGAHGLGTITEGSAESNSSDNLSTDCLRNDTNDTTDSIISTNPGILVATATSEWDFAPIVHPCIRLDGLASIDANVKAILSIMGH